MKKWFVNIFLYIVMYQNSKEIIVTSPVNKMNNTNNLNSLNITRLCLHYII